MTAPDGRIAPTTILVVDDNPENLTVLSQVLLPLYRVRVATDGVRALAIVESEDPPDLILLDVMMPGMNGFEVCERIKANPTRRDIPIIFVSALGDEEDEKKGLELGAIDYVTKPISAPIVIARVKNHLELKFARNALARQNILLDARVSERTSELVKLNDELKATLIETIELAFDVMSEAHEELANHCKRVAAYSKDIAQRMGLSTELTFDIHAAGLLHDLGLLGVPDIDLKRLLRLSTPSQTKDSRYWDHPIVQMRGLSTSSRFANTMAIIAGHHENLDGTGFPARVMGEGIPMGSRILAVADHWDIFSQFEPNVRGEPPTFQTFRDQFIGKLDVVVLEAFSEVLSKGDPFSNVVEKNIADLEVGNILARAIRMASGGILLSAGTTLRADHVRNLERYAARKDIKSQVSVYRRAPLDHRLGTRQKEFEQSSFGLGQVIPLTSSLCSFRIGRNLSGFVLAVFFPHRTKP